MATELIPCIPQAAEQTRLSRDSRQSILNGPAWFVAVCWVIMLGLSLFIVWKWGYNLPFIDEYGFVPYLCGEQKITWEYLWSQNNEHRFPIPRLLYMGLVLLSGGDFRAPMYFSVLAMGGLTLGLMVTAHRLRGRTSWTDAFFPLTGLGAAHADVFLWGMELLFVCSALLAGLLLYLMCRNRDYLSLGSVCLAGVALVLLPLCGANGLGLVPALALWLAYAGYRAWRTPGLAPKVGGAIAWCWVLGAVGLIRFYFVGYQNYGFPRCSSVTKLLVAVSQLLAMGFGPIARPTWPYSGILATGLVVVSAAFLVIRFYREPENRLRSLGLLFFLGAIGTLALGMAYGRAECSGGLTFLNRYGILTVPFLWAVFFTAVLVRRVWLRRLFQAGLLIGAAILVPVNWQKGGLEFAHWHAGQMEAFRQQVAAEVPAHVLALRFAPVIYGWPDQLEHHFISMHAAGLGDLRELRGNDSLEHLQEVPLAAQVHWQHQVSWDGQQGQTLGDCPILIFKLHEPRYVSAIRFQLTFQDLHRGPHRTNLQASWRVPGVPETDPSCSQGEQIPVDGAPHQVTLWVFNRMDQLVLFLGNEPNQFKLSNMAILSPESDGKTAQVH